MDTFSVFLKQFVGKRFYMHYDDSGIMILDFTTKATDTNTILLEVHEDYLIVTSATVPRKAAIPFYLLRIVH